MTDHEREFTLSRIKMLNYKMAVHEGDANRRLSYYAEELLLIPIDYIPPASKKEFQKLQELIELTIDSLISPGLKPLRLRGIYNSSAAKYIKLLWTIECELE